MEKETPENKHIYIIGPRRLQNELLASFLERETGVGCTTLDRLGDLPVREVSEKELKRLIFWDFFHKDLKTFLSDIEAYGEEIFTRDPFLIFNVSEGLGIEEMAIEYRIKGVFYESDPLENYTKGVRAVFKGELWLSREVMSSHILKKIRSDHTSKKDVASLSRREVEVLSMVAIGCTNEEIADNLFISPNTVKTHIYNIFKKINVINRLQAALWAAKNL